MHLELVVAGFVVVPKASFRVPRIRVKGDVVRAHVWIASVWMLAASRKTVCISRTGNHEPLAFDGFAFAVERWDKATVRGFHVAFAAGYGITRKPRVGHGVLDEDAVLLFPRLLRRGLPAFASLGSPRIVDLAAGVGRVEGSVQADHRQSGTAAVRRHEAFDGCVGTLGGARVTPDLALDHSVQQVFAAVLFQLVVARHALAEELRSAIFAVIARRVLQFVHAGTLRARGVWRAVEDLVFQVLAVRSHLEQVNLEVVGCGVGVHV